jgi:FecR protein
MSSPPDPRAELRELCDRLLDGGFTAEDRERLETLVLNSAELRTLYVEILHQHAALRQSASRLGAPSLSGVVDVLTQAREFHLQSGWWARFTSRPKLLPEASFRDSYTFVTHFHHLAVAVIVGALLITWAVLRPHGEPALATLVETKNARWESSSLPTEPGSKLGHGRLRLAEGVARIIFQSGAELSLEGPAELELVNRNACFLHSGALVAHVPKPARGFVVATANAQLIDHGTDFGISTDPAGRAQVQVLQGDVELRHDRSGQTLRLATRESASITADQLTPGKKGESEPDRNAFARPEQPPAQPILALTTGTGSGDAAYVVSPNSPLHNSDTLLLLKNSPDRRYLRKAFLRFDLGALRDRRIAEATLTLNFEATGFGYASLVGESVFAVYGVTDEKEDEWSAATLTWENAPAFSPDGGSVDPGRAAKLGTFTLPEGVVSGAPALGGPALTAFLNAHANRRATLIIVRESSEAKPNAAVHGFAGNRHPTLAPPTLRLTLAEP